MPKRPSPPTTRHIARALLGTLFGALAVITVSARLDTIAVAANAPNGYNTNGQGTLIVLGDSLTVGTDYFGSLTKRLTNLNIWTKVLVDAKVGRKTSAGATQLTKLLKANPTTTAIVMALGTNDMISHSEKSYPPIALSNIMRVTGTLPVLWINTTFSATIHSDWLARAKRLNALLSTTSRSTPSLRVADWAHYFTPKGPSRFISDGVHLTVSGYKTRATFMESEVASFGAFVVAATSTTSTSSTTSTVPTSTSTTVPTSTSSTSTTTPSSTSTTTSSSIPAPTTT